MTRFAAFLLTVAFAAPAVADDAKPKKKKKAAGPSIAHMVYFKLKDGSDEAKKKLVDACKQHLSDHAGTTYFSAGVSSKAFDRPVNDQDWDVALHLVFADKAAHDTYQDHERHKKFIEENKENWAKVRVFDAECEPAAKTKMKKAAK